MERLNPHLEFLRNQRASNRYIPEATKLRANGSPFWVPLADKKVALSLYTHPIATPLTSITA